MVQQGRRAVVFILALVCVIAGTSGAVLAGTATSQAATDSRPELVGGDGDGSGQGAVVTGPQPQTDNSIDITHEFRLTPNEAGQIDVQWQFEIPDSVVNMTVRKPDAATDIEVSGFIENQDSFVWEDSAQTTATPSVTFTFQANETTEDGAMKYADTGDWALIKRPPIASLSRYYYRGTEPSITRTNVTAGEGVVANAMVYMGEYEMTTRSEHGQQFRLVVPEAATPTADSTDIFDSVTAASDTLRVGDRDETVTMFAAPTTVPWGVAGLQRGDNAFYTVANLSVDDPNNTWIHEYVHTRQDFTTRDSTRWFIEASAEYYAAQLTLQQGRIDFDSFSDSLSLGADRRYDDVVLANPDSWHDSADYEKGGLAAGELDRRIRLASEKSNSLQTTFQQLNSYDSSITIGQQRFISAIETAGGTTVGDTARQFTETTEGPEMWSQRQHDDAFSALPAQFSYTFPAVGSSGLQVRGPYRNGTASSNRLVTGETLVADIAVENVGGTRGSYNLTIARDGVPIVNRTGTAAAGEVVTETVAVDFTTAGTYRFSTGTDSLRVHVEKPATVSVADVFTNRTTIEGSGAVRVTAVVTNGDDRPGTGVVAIQQGDTTLIERDVSLDSGEATDIVATATLSELGTTVFSAGNKSVDVTVEEVSTPTPKEVTTGDSEQNTDNQNSDDDTAGSSGPGFGVVGALVAIVALLVVAHRVE